MKKPSLKEDMEILQKLMRQGKLDAVVQKLDPSDIPGSLRRVPKAVIRLLVQLLSVKDVDKKLEDVDATQRKLAEALLASARKHQGEGYAKKLRDALVKDEELRRSLGFTLAKTRDALADKIDNAVNRIVHTPILTLKTGRVYVEVVLCRSDDVLLRTEVELDDLLFMSASLIQAAQEGLQYLKENASGASPKIEYERCEDFLHELKESAGKVRGLLHEFKEPKKEKRPKTAKPKRARSAQA